MGFGKLLSGLGAVGAAVAAPFTGGGSLAFLPGRIGAGTSLAGGILEGTKGARTSTSTTTPTLAPEYKTLADLLRSRAEERLRQSTDLSGYTTNGISDINQAYGGAQMASNANLTARGLASSPVAGAVGANYDLARAGNISQFLNTIPQLQRQFQNEDFNAANQVIGLGRGTESTGVAPGSALGGGLSSAGDLLGYLSGLGIFGQGGGPRRTKVQSPYPGGPV